MTSIKDIARLAGVSPSTVSRVINNRDYVRDEIRDKVMAIVKEKGYVQNHVARSMVLRRTFTVGIVIPDTFNMFQRQLFATIEHHLEQQGYRTMFIFVTWSAESEAACLRKLKGESLDGIIMMHEVQNPSIYKYLHEYSGPVVLCTFGSGDFSFPAVHVDESAAAEAAVAHLAEKGHRRIGLIAGAHFHFSIQRAEGYKRAFGRYGIEAKDEWRVTVPAYSLEDGRLGMEKLLSRNSGLTAVFAMTDELAIGAMRSLHEAGLSVPGDVSVVGFDDIDISAYTTPALTTIRQPIPELGEKTASLVCDLIANGKSDRSPIVLPHRLIQRESVAPPRENR
ncbi:MAG TPA: LacI family DNA-binding transcriptional regulator [Rectinemataceae bacterium]|nr:LacI family DNA-binding transcriptional regulator [Rectinemataceae bacterium]